MPLVRRFLHGLCALYRKKQLEHELDEELQAFIAAAAEQKMRAGMSGEQALHAARVDVGSATAVKDKVNEAGWESIIEGFWQDVRYGLRTLRNSPGFTAVAVITLALGIGVYAGIFTILNAVALRPLPVADSGELVGIYQNLRGRFHRVNQGSLAMSSYSEYLDFRNHNHIFSGLLAYDPFASATLNSGSSRQIMGTLASCNYFDVLKVRPVLGRDFTESECAVSGSTPAVILNNDLWRTDFGSDPRIIGKVIHLNRVPFTVIGIAPSGFSGTEMVSSMFWAPLTMQGSLMHQENFAADPSTGWLFVIGRLKSGVSLAQARADLGFIAAQGDQLEPGRTTVLSVSRATFASEPEERTIVFAVGAVILCAVGLVLLIACTNIANLLLARAAGRGREIAVRLALGARRSRIVRQLLTESLLLALIGGFFGTLTAFWLPAAVVHFLLSHLPPGSWIFALDAHPDLRVVGYALTLTLITGIAFGLAPALKSSRADLSLASRQDVMNTESQRRRPRFLRNALVGLQVAMCMVLLSAAGLLVRGLYRAQNLDPGFAIKDISVTSFDLNGAGYDKQRVADFQGKLRDRLSSFPGIDAVAQSAVTPLDSNHLQTNYIVPETEQEFRAEYNLVSAGYFSLLAIPIVRGRDFTGVEQRTNAPVAILTESTARRLWPGKDPIGRTLRSAGLLQVVGVAKDVQVSYPGQSDTTYIYLPAGPDSQSRLRTLVHSAAGFSSTERAIRSAVAQLDPELTVSISKLEDNLEFWRAPSRILSLLSGVLGGLALILAAIGIYGMVSYSVSRRIREIGIRMALGANAGNVMALVLRQAMQPVMIGAVAGVAACAAVSGILSNLLYGISPHDPVSFICVIAFFVAVALFASYMPARRAMRVDPIVALRYE